MLGAVALCLAGGLLAVTSIASELVVDSPPSAASVDQWKIVASSNASELRDNKLLAVTCIPSSDCWAVGYYDTNVYVTGPDIFIHQTLIERWNGARWIRVESPNTSLSDYNVLNGITCASQNDCWAVGWHGATNFTVAETLIEHWNGKKWVIVSSPNNNGNGSFGSVTCSSRTDCWAVGEYFTPDNGERAPFQTLIARWDGASWTIVSSPNSSPIQDNYLNNVTCTSALDCWAVGFYNNSQMYGNIFVTGPNQTLTEHWEGTSWTIVPSRNANTQDHNALNGVTCTSASDCWAVGYYLPGNNVVVGNYGQRLIERWDGTLGPSLPRRRILGAPISTA